MKKGKKNGREGGRKEGTPIQKVDRSTWCEYCPVQHGNTIFSLDK